MGTGRSAGAARDFRGTYWVQVRLDALGKALCAARTTLVPESIRITDEAVCRNCNTVQPHVTVLLGLPEAPPEDWVAHMAAVEPFDMKLGPLQLFPAETVMVDGVAHSYQVLSVEVEETRELLELQRRAGERYGVSWHHPKFRAHITVAFVRAGQADHLVGRRVPGLGSVHVDRVTLRKFQDTAVAPRDIVLIGNPASPRPEAVSAAAAAGHASLMGQAATQAEGETKAKVAESSSGGTTAEPGAPGLGMAGTPASATAAPSPSASAGQTMSTDAAVPTDH